MRLVRLRLQIQHLLPIKTEKLLRLLHKKPMAQNGFGRILVGLMIQSVLAAKIRDVAFRRYPGPAEKYDVLRIPDPGLQRLDLLHKIPPPTSSIPPMHRQQKKKGRACPFLSLQPLAPTGGCLKHLAQRVGIVRLDGIFDLIQLRFKTPDGRQQVFLVAQKQLAP